jgi:putative endonuclease
MNKVTQGRAAETKVATYLRTRGYKILGRNYTIRGGEIDIIAKKDSQIVFVEVKSLSSEKYVGLLDTISEKKKHTLIRTCRYWLWDKELADADWRLDFIGVIIETGGKIKKLQHIENALSY